MAKILLVDDDQLLVRMFQKKLQSDGYEVEVADNGADGIAKIALSKPDLIVSDIMMPKMNGLEMLTKLKQNKETDHIPVILLTNIDSSEADVEKGLELGAVTYLVKASTGPAAVISKVKEILAGYVHEVPQVKNVINVDDKLKN